MQTATSFFQKYSSEITNVRFFTFPICPFVEAIKIAALESKINLDEILVDIRENANVVGEIATWPKKCLGYKDHLTTPTMVIDFNNDQRIICNDTMTMLRIFENPAVEIPNFLAANNLNINSKTNLQNELLEQHNAVQHMLKPNGIFLKIMSQIYKATITSDEALSKEIINNELTTVVAEFEDHLSKRTNYNGPYYFGDKLTLIDKFVAGQFARFHELDINYGIKILNKDSHPKLSKYCNNVLSNNSVVAILGKNTAFSGLLNDLYVFKNSYLANIGQKNGVIPISATAMVNEFKRNPS